MAGGVWYLQRMGALDRQSGDRPDRLPVRHPAAADPGEPDLRRLEAAPADAGAKATSTCNRFSPTGFYSSAVQQPVPRRAARSARSARSPTAWTPSASTVPPLRGRAPAAAWSMSRPTTGLDAAGWVAQGFTEALRTPDSTLIFVTPEKADEIHTDQIELHGLPVGLPVLATGRRTRAAPPAARPIPRSFCIQKTLQDDRPWRRCRRPADVRRAQRLPLRGRPVLRERLHPDGPAAGGAHRHGDCRQPRPCEGFSSVRIFQYIAGMNATHGPFAMPLGRLRAGRFAPDAPAPGLGTPAVRRRRPSRDGRAAAWRGDGARAEVSLATVYNTLNQFTDAGLLREVVVEPGRVIFRHQRPRPSSLLLRRRRPVSRTSRRLALPSSACPRRRPGSRDRPCRRRACACAKT